MIRRFASILVIAIALMSFFVSSSFAQDENMHKKKPVKKEHVMKKKAHKMKKAQGYEKRAQNGGKKIQNDEEKES